MVNMSMENGELEKWFGKKKKNLKKPQKMLKR